MATDHRSRAGYEPILNALFPLYPDLMQSGRGRVKSQYRKVAPIAHGWYMRCHRSSRALLELDRMGFAEEASPIRRSIIEHVVALKWLAAEGDAVEDTIARGHAFKAKVRADAASDAGWHSFNTEAIAELIAEIDADARNKSNDQLLHFAHRVKQYGDVHTLPGYLAECEHTHPSYESAVCFVELDSRMLLDQPWTASIWQVPFATTHLLEATLVFHDIFDEPPWTDELERLVERYKEVTNHVRAEDRLPLINWDAPGGPALVTDP